jgi:hypothetical protein
VENQIGNRSITSLKIAQNVIVNDHISETAKISHSKLNVSWLIPVARSIDLPANANNGDCCLVLETNHIYRFSGSWKQETGKEAYPVWLWTQDDKIFYLQNYVGIGTDAPEEKLHIHNGSLKISKDFDAFTISPVDKNLVIEDSLFINKNSFIGINNSNPTKELDVAGDIKAFTVFANLTTGSAKVYYDENKLKLE